MIFLLFHCQDYPSSSSTTGTLTGLGVCAFAFYLGLLLILIGLWHQKYRHENPKKIVAKPSQHEDSSTDLRTSMEDNENYDYSYQQPTDYGAYGAYGGYGNPSYAPNANEQTGTAYGSGSYDPGAWPSTVPIETKPNPKFMQSMEMSFGAPPVAETPSTMIGSVAPSAVHHNTTVVAAPVTTTTTVTQIEEKRIVQQ